MNPCRKTVETTVLPVVGRTVVRTHGPPIAGMPAGSDTGLTMMTGTLAAAMTTLVPDTMSAMRNVASTAMMSATITIKIATTETTLIDGTIVTTTTVTVTVITAHAIDLPIEAPMRITTNLFIIAIAAGFR